MRRGPVYATLGPFSGAQEQLHTASGRGGNEDRLASAEVDVRRLLREARVPAQDVRSSASATPTN